MKKSLVSVIIPAHNAARFIDRALISACKNTEVDVDIVLVDDRSTDATVAVAARCGAPIRVIANSGTGASAARNTGLEHAHGQFIQFLDADDELAPGKLDIEVGHLGSNRLDVVFGDWRHCFEVGDCSALGPVVEARPPGTNILDAALSGWWLPCHSLLYRRSVLESLRWNDSLEAAQDRLFLLEVLISLDTPCYLPGCRSIYWRHQGPSISTVNLRRWTENHAAALREVERILKRRGALAPHAPSLSIGVRRLALTAYQADRYLFRDLMEWSRALDPSIDRFDHLARRTLRTVLGDVGAEVALSAIRPFRSVFKANSSGIERMGSSIKRPSRSR